MIPAMYPINVFWSGEDKAWVADVPDLDYCSATGDTPHERATRSTRLSKTTSVENPTFPWSEPLFGPVARLGSFLYSNSPAYVWVRRQPGDSSWSQSELTDCRE